MVIDYRKLNEKTIDDKFPIPNINDILDKLGRANYFTTLDLASGYHQVEVEELDKLGRANYFTTLDLASGYHQVEVEEQDREKTAFSTDDGHSMRKLSTTSFQFLILMIY
ncbi:hypothetical protein QE152_g34132 [Popillia japonica]|uniref:Reverse transcriptase domain-containing protein n=1 Tax=Popillia japonica TaxID=7064 RepID=A0AAW1IUW5_POPJA